MRVAAPTIPGGELWVPARARPRPPLGLVMVPLVPSADACTSTHTTPAAKTSSTECFTPEQSPVPPATRLFPLGSYHRCGAVITCGAAAAGASGGLVGAAGAAGMPSRGGDPASSRLLLSCRGSGGGWDEGSYGFEPV
jgi:hypothetical protein